MSYCVGYVPRPLGTTGEEDSGCACLDRLQLRVRFSEETVRRPAQAEERGHPIGVGLWLDGRGQDHHVHVRSYKATQISILGPHSQFVVGQNLHLGPSATHESDPFLLDPLVELLVGLAESPHVHEKIVHLGPSLVPNLMGLLERIHAAEPGAVAMCVLVPATDAVDDRHPFRLLALSGEDFSAGWSPSGGDALELQPGDDIG